MDVLRLIEEVKKRPILWDHKPDNKDRPNLTAIWQQVADAVGSNVKTCKAKWRNLRDAFRAEVRRSQRRAAKYKNVCKNDPRAKGTSKWAYFVPLSFLVKSQRPALAASSSASPTHERIKNDDDDDDDDNNTQHSNEEPTATSTTAAAASTQATSASYVHSSEDSNCISFTSDYDIKEEAVHILSDDEDGDEEEDFEVNIDEEMFHNDEQDQDMLFNQFQNLATPQAMRRLSHSISVANAAAEDQQHKRERHEQEEEEDVDRKVEPTDLGNKIDIMPAAIAMESSPSAPATTTPTSTTTTSAAAATVTNQDCKCAKRVDEQVNFLENLEREEEKLILSTRQDITRCKDMLHIGDSDYNFLISFLPLMKKMSDLQNIHFRAKMSELLVHTMGMGPPPPPGMHTTSSLSQVIATPLGSFNPASLCSSAQAQPQLFILQQAPPSAGTPVTTNAQIQQPMGNAQVTTSSTTQWN